jgi:hypothetical protein
MPPSPSKKRKLKLAEEPDLIKAIQKDIAELGVVGEVQNGTLVYMTGTSRKLANPIRLILKGPSGSGKSTLQIISRMFPSGECIEATSLTPNALYHMKPGSLKHKFFIAGERKHTANDEAADESAAKRQLLSEHKITKHTVRKGEHVYIEQEGPIAYCETTTSDNIFAEDLNRCLLVRTDDSSSQTRRVMKAIAAKYADNTTTDRTEQIIQRHHEYQESLEHLPIVIPFAEALAEEMPVEKVAMRRAFGLVLSTIETTALMHQSQREKDSQGRLIATIEDYEIARQLVLQPLGCMLDYKHRELMAYVELERLFGGRRFTSTEAIKAGIFNDRDAARNVLNRLKALRILTVFSKPKGRKPTVWEWTGHPLVLPMGNTIAGDLCRQPTSRKKRPTQRKGLLL